MAEGWICPRCGRGLAPWMSECPCHNTTTTVTSNYEVTLPNNHNNPQIEMYRNIMKEVKKEN